MDYLEINRAAWDKKVGIHVISDFYNVDGFLRGETSLREIELAELLDVNGKTLLHLQCHFGLDTLSWARKGAIVTGVDISTVAIKQANELKEKVNIDARFICTDVYQVGEIVEEPYDIVFTSYGALNWLPDLTKWAETISKSLKTNGQFYMIEFHPTFDLVSGYSYFNLGEPDIEEGGTYTENGNDELSTMMTWSHSISEVLNALIYAGIQINQFNEFPFSPYNCFEGLVEREKGHYYAEGSKHNVPMVYSVKGTKIE